MKLYIVQHGKALSADEDPQRPLSVQGADDVGQLASELAARQARPAYLLHSGRLRALMTADIIASALDMADRCRQADGLKPNDDAAAFAARLGSFTGDVLIASHLPFVQNLCDELLGESGVEGFEFSPGGCVCIRLDDSGATLEWSRVAG